MTGYGAVERVDFTDIPVIDISGRDDPTLRPALAARLVETAQSVGFFYIAGHGIPSALRAQAFAVSKQFFKQSIQAKATVSVDQNQRGWMAQGLSTLEGSKTHDAKEVFFWGWEIAEDDPDLGLPLVALNRWPETVPLQAGIMPYYLSVVDLGRQVLELLADGLGADADLLRRAYEKPLARGQLVYYPPVNAHDEIEQRYSAAPHTDFGVLTVLAQDDRGGLQVRNAAGDWIEAPPVADTFVCNIGDLLERWSGGRLRSTAHRVINRSGKSRFSIPVFCDPSSGTPIAASELIPGTDPGEVVTAGDYIARKNRRNFRHYKS